MHQEPRDNPETPRPDESNREFLTRLAAEQDGGTTALIIAHELAAMQEGLTESEHCAATALIFASLLCQRSGNIRMPLDTTRGSYLTDEVVAFAQSDVDRDKWKDHLGVLESLFDREGLSTIVGLPGDPKPLIRDRTWLYHHRSLDYERWLAQHLCARFRQKPPNLGNTDSEQTTNTVFAEFPTLSEEQRTALSQCVSNSVTLITGGPGTGKTTIVVAMIQLFLALGAEPSKVLTAAPTGKASNRLDQGLQKSAVRGLLDLPRPKTLHRLLRYQPTKRRFAHNRSNPLRAEVVIVDEASMIDLALMTKLVEALPTEARLILLGDADQLPSVDTGSVFRDLIDLGSTEPTPSKEVGSNPGQLDLFSAPAPSSQSRSATLFDDRIVRLTRNFRLRGREESGRQILRLANWIKRGGDGEIPELSSAKASPDELEFEGAEWIDLENPIQGASGTTNAFYDFWYENRLRSSPELESLSNHNFPFDGRFHPEDCSQIDRIFRRHTRNRILCLTRHNPYGVNAANDRIQRRFAETQKRTIEHRFGVGDPVMMLKNDYDRGLFNGDQGVILNVTAGDTTQLMAVFSTQGQYRPFHIGPLSQRLDLAFANTVHKSQGSEHDCVALILPSEPIPLLSRELLYTAVTRAKRSVVVVGAQEILLAGAQKPIQRFSGLTERIGASQIDSSTS